MSTAQRDDTAEVRFLNPYGLPCAVAARFGPTTATGEVRRTRRLTGDQGWVVDQHLVTVRARAAYSAREEVEREIGAAVAIVRRVGESPPSAAFLPFVGYDLDGSEPFVLYRPSRGEPVARLAGRLPNAEWQRLVQSLAVAIRVLHAAGVVHRDITPWTVRWDGEEVQLGRPATADLAGRRRVAVGSWPYAAPEQLAGHGRLDSRDDLWSLAQVGYFLLTGRPAASAGPPPDLAHMPLLDRSLRPLFAVAAAARPDPVQTVRLLSCADRLAAERVGDPLAAGRHAFDPALRTKRALAAAGPVAPSEDGRTRTWFRRPRPTSPEE